MKERCIIYGGGGFIGSHIADELLKKKLHVTLFDKVNATKKNFEHIIDRVDYIEGDFNNPVDIKNSLSGNQYVIHLVSSTLPAESNLNPLYDAETNLLSSIRLFDECTRAGIKKVIFISSGGTVYGNPVKLPIGETHPTNPTSSYGIIKLAVEKYLSMFFSLKGLDYTILRFSNPFGERQNPRLSQGLIAHLLYRIKHEKPLEIWGDGSVIRDYFYIGDGARAVYLALKNRSGTRTFNISSGKGRSVDDILDKFRKVLKLKFIVKYTEKRRFDVPANVLDNRLAGKILKWKPKADFNESLKKTWRFILEHE